MLGRLSAVLGAAKAGTAATVVGAVAAVAVCSTLVVRSSEAVFTGGTDNTGNSWATGTVALSDDDTGVALFNSATDGELTGGQVLTRCISVKYDGTLVHATTVKLYGTASGALAPYLALTVDQGTGGGGAGSCTGFSATASGVYAGSLADFAANANGFATGVASWSPTSQNATMTYRLSLTVGTVTAAQGKSASGTFTWEARG